MSAEVLHFPGSDPNAPAVHPVERHIFNSASQNLKAVLASLLAATAGRLAALDLPFAVRVLENTLAALKRGASA